MADFSRYTNFKDNAGVSGVVFGSLGTVLEVELNEMQEINKSSMRNMIAKIIGDGITDLSALTYEGGKVKIGECGIAVDGILINCTGLQLTASSGTVYLQVWEDVDDYQVTLKKEGNQQETIPVANWMKDNRYEGETTKRKVVKYTLANSINNDRHNLAIASISNSKMTKLVKEINLSNISNMVGGNCGIVVTAPAGYEGVTITATCGDKVVTGVVDDDLQCKLGLPNTGLWTVTNSKNSCANKVNVEFYAFYPCKLYKVMTININMSNSNPETSVTYADDAVTMTPGSHEWDEFFGHYPCIMTNGVEGVRLDPDDFTKDINGNSVDITTVADSDVMIKFPRRGVKISTNGNVCTVSMTDDPENPGFKYYAHQRGRKNKTAFYVGAYKGFVSSGKLYSLSGKTPTGNQTIGTFRGYAHARGAGYEQSTWFQLIFRQVCYYLKYKNLNSQAVVGTGYVKSSHTTTTNTGGTNQYGMDCEKIKATNPSYMTDQDHQVKCLGIEDFWGNIWEWVDGLCTDASYNMLVANDNYNDSGSGYASYPSGASSNDGGYMTVCQGTTEKGFAYKTKNGSETTHFCDGAFLYASCVATFGGTWDYALNAGVAPLYVSNAASHVHAAVGGRLVFVDPSEDKVA